MARALQNRLTHLLTTCSTPSCLRVSQLHTSNVVSQRFWNQLNLEYSQKNNDGAKRNPVSKVDCSSLATNEPSACFLKGKPSVGELLSQWCSRRFDDKFHYDEAPQTPYYRHRPPRLPKRPCSQAPFCPTRQPEPKPCEQPKTYPPQSCVPCKMLSLSAKKPREPCKHPNQRNPDPDAKTRPPRPYPAEPCEPCPRRNSCPEPKPCPRRPSCPCPAPPPPPPPKPSCPGACDPCRPKPTPMGCPVRRCCRAVQQRPMRTNNVSMGISGGMSTNRLGDGQSAKTSHIRRFHNGSTLEGNRTEKRKGPAKKAKKRGRAKIRPCARAACQAAKTSLTQAASAPISSKKNMKKS